MKYEKIENVYKRNSNRKNSKWKLDFTNAKIIEDNQYNRIIQAFDNVPPYYEKYKKEYKSLKNIKGVKYETIYNLTKREIILIPLED